MVVFCYVEVAVVEGFHCTLILNLDQGCWLFYRRWPLLRGNYAATFSVNMNSIFLLIAGCTCIIECGIKQLAIDILSLKFVEIQ